jgi:zinc D-Ala-D-Ala carboxypeptidase
VAVASGAALLTGAFIGVAAAVQGNRPAGNPGGTSPAATAEARPTPTAARTAPPTDPPVRAFDLSAHSTTEPGSPWIVVNKRHPLRNAEGFVPDLAELPPHIPNPNGHRLHPDAAAALTRMFAAAAEEIGVTLVAQSGYRSYQTQVSTYQGHVDNLGVEAAELTSARPGFSEHQTGLAVDILDTTSGCGIGGPCFGNTAGGKWLAANAHRFGFILRYPADKTDVTGFEFEPWHFRFVGTELATEMRDRGISTLEELFGIPGGREYR